jgi:hypothetical protein
MKRKILLQITKHKYNKLVNNHNYKIILIKKEKISKLLKKIILPIIQKLTMNLYWNKILLKYY